MDILKVFIGVDSRNPIDYTILQHSIHRHAKQPVSVTPLIIEQLPIKRRGLTDFTYTRYLVPYLCGFKGKAVFLDSDMVVMDDINELIKYSDAPVSVVKSEQRFEWTSLMVFDCKNNQCKTLTPEWISNIENHPQKLDWATHIGDVPAEWNHIIGYDDKSEMEKAKILHYTMGTPAFIEILESELGGEYPWLLNEKAAIGRCSWLALHGNSVHAPKIIERLKQTRVI
jgi:hypothetical protein